MNYRLGLLGNLYMEGVAPGNLSVSDLERALQWVKKNIESFGGDPDSIVLAGQSAGAWYAQLLAAMPTTHALVKSVAMLSYPGLQPLDPVIAHAMGVRLCEGAGISTSGEALAALPVERILREQAKLLAAEAKFGEVPIAFMPVASEGVPADPGAAARVRFGGKPVFIGWTRDETGSFFASNAAVVSATEEQVLHKFNAEFGDDAVGRYASMAEGRFDRRPYAALVEMSSEKLFKAPGLRFAKGMAEAASDVFAYQFDFQSVQPNVGACHCFELPFFFGNFENWAQAPMLDGIDVQRGRELSARIRSYFLNFVESGNPNGADLLQWKAFGGGGGEMMHFA
jgi:para-nitrobenzyl esterase